MRLTRGGGAERSELLKAHRSFSSRVKDYLSESGCRESLGAGFGSRSVPSSGDLSSSVPMFPPEEIPEKSAKDRALYDSLTN